MERCGFFDAYLAGDEYDRVYLAQHFAAYFASFIGNGVFAEHANQLQVMALPTPQMQILVEKGQGFINGYWYENTSDMILSIDVADGVLNRIDSVVLRFGTTERNIWLAVNKGTPAINPSPPAITRSADYYELQLATINVKAGSIKITQSQISDTRMDRTVCGWVTGVVKQLDTTNLFNQFETYFSEFKSFYEAGYRDWTEEQKSRYLSWITAQKQDVETWEDNQKNIYNNWYSNHISLWQTAFETWFENIRGQLRGDLAGNLQSQISEHEARLDNVEKMIIKGSAFAPAEISSGELLTTSDNEVIVCQWTIY